jgi:hypothetical protein
VVPIDNIITISTPVREYQFQYSNVKVHNQVYNTKDWVQDSVEAQDTRIARFLCHWQVMEVLGNLAPLEENLIEQIILK